MLTRIEWATWASAVVVALLCAAALLMLPGCSITRWEAEDGRTEVRHGLTIRLGWEFYIGDDGQGFTEGNWTAAKDPEPTAQPAGIEKGLTSPRREGTAPGDSSRPSD